MVHHRAAPRARAPHARPLRRRARQAAAWDLQRPRGLRRAPSSPLLGPLPSGGEGGSAAYPGSDGASSPAKVIYRRYASLYFVAGVDGGDNELPALESVHLLVEALDLYFGNVCELDLVFNFHKAHWLVDELVVGGRLVEPSRRAAVRAAEAQDRAVEEAKAERGSSSRRWGRTRFRKKRREGGKGGREGREGPQRDPAMPIEGLKKRKK